MEIGFIGLGSMGSRIVDLMLDAGYQMTLWARREASLEPFADRARTAQDPAEVGRASDLVGICVWDESDVDAVLLGERGVLAGMRPGGVVALHSTIAPAACRRLAREAAGRGIRLLDAPVSVGANSPKLLVMVGGDPGVVEEARPVLETFGDPVVHLGPIGSGQIAKIVNNTMLAATVTLGSDALAFGADLGIDQDALLAVLAMGSAGGTWTRLLSSRHPDEARVPSSRTDHWATKDVALAVELVTEAQGDLGRDVLRLAARCADALS
jgi:3-hydroxyisobutyrate dehydrogenase-like beta-hydroxyacid dehydrogenase